MTALPPNICVSCRHFSFGYCLAAPTARSPINGQQFYRLAEYERVDPDQQSKDQGSRGNLQCGPEGKNFEPLPPKISWWLRFAWRMSQ